MAVAYDNSTGTFDFGVTSLTTGTFTISGSNRAVFLSLAGYTNITSITTSCGGATATDVTGALANDNGYYIYGRSAVAPATGSQTATASWTTAATQYLSVITATGVNQTTPVNGGTANEHTGSARTTLGVTVTSATGDMTTSSLLTQNDFWSTNQTERYDNLQQVVDTAAGASSVTHTWSGTSNNVALVGANFVAFVNATLEQEGFRWGVDDGSESAHTWEAAQDTNISIADTQSRLLRVLVNATLDPSATAYTLRYQKNGSGGYVAVPVGSTTKTTPVIESGDATESGSNTASTSWAVSYPNASTGDLLIFCISWDDSTTTTDVTEPAGPNGETLSEVNATPATDSGTAIRCKVWYTKATGTWTASTLTFTPSASEQWTASVVRVPAGEFDSTTPIGASDTEGGAAAGTSVNHGAFSAGASDGSGKLCVWTAVDVNPQTVASGFSQVSNTDRGAVSGGFFTRDTAVTDSESFSATAAATITSENWATVAFVVRAPSVSNEVYITTSGNIAGGGEATTARLTAPSGKTTSDFVTGRRWDDENGTDTIDITTDDYTEVEWNVAISSAPVDTDYFEFRVYAGSSALATYTLTPKWTIGTAAVNVTPGTATLTITRYAPTVSAPRNVTPGIATLTLTPFAPSVSIGIVVTPGTASLTTTRFAPTVAAPRNVTPGIASLTLTLFAPTVATPRNVTPGPATLTLATFAPTVTATAHVTVTPGASALTLTTFAPTVQAGGNLEVVPGTASLTLTRFAPTVTTTAHQNVTPGTASVTLTTFAPTVTVGNAVEVTPGPASLTLTLFEPTVEVSIDDVEVVIFGGDDAPRKRKRRKERHELFQELEATVHGLLHPAELPFDQVSVEGASEARSIDAERARRAVDELVVLAEGQHQLIQRAAALRAELAQLEIARREQEEEDEFLMFM